MVRPDGRRADQVRPVTIVPDYSPFAEGSALIEVGGTHVLCTATVEEQVPPWLRSRGSRRGWVTAEYSMLPRATPERTRRERGVTLGGRTQEIQRLIGRSLRAAVDLEALGERTIILDCDVLRADGGTRTASITGAYVALYRAVQNLVKAGKVEHWPLRWAVAAVSVGLVAGDLCLDLVYAEDSSAEVDLNVVMTDQNRFVEVQGTAEGLPFEQAQLDDMLRVAGRGIKDLFRAQKKALGLE